MLNSLEDYRDRMLAITDRADTHLQRCTPAGVAELVRCRAEMARVLTIFQLFVHREVFAPMVASSDPAQRRRGAHLKAECIALTEEFRHTSKRWTNVDLAAHWHEYRPIAQGFRRRILDHLETVMALGTGELSRAA